MLDKLTMFLKNTIIYLSRSIITYIFLLMIFIDRNIEYYTANYQVITNWVLLIIIIFDLFIVYKYRENIKIYLTKADFKVWLIIILFILFIYQIISIYSYYFYTGWDALTVRQAAFTLIEHPEQLANFNSYFSYHVNQLFITTILGTLFKIGTILGLSNPYSISLIASILMIDLSGLLTSLCVKELTKRNDLALLSLILFVLLLGISPWVSIPYTDTYSILFSISIFYLYIKQFKLTSINYFKWILIIFLSFIGGSIKPQVYIVLIAIVIFETLQILEKKKSVKHYLLIVVIASISFFGTQSLYSNWMSRFDFKLWPDRAFTYTHYIMTGLNPVNYGVYLDSDASLSYEAPTIEDRQAANLEVIYQRLNDYGVFGFVDFFTHKVLINYNDGTFAWNGEGGFIVEIFNDKSSVSTFYKELFYPDGNYYSVFLVFEQFVWIMTLLLMLIGLYGRKNKLNILVLLIFIGGFLFIQLFEARGRYLIGYLPFYIILATLGFERILDSDGRVNVKIKS